MNNPPEKKAKEEMAQAFSDYYNAKVVGYAKENKSITPGEVDVAFIGDSLTDECDLKTYYPGLYTVNRGIGGDNINQMFDNYENILISMNENLPNSDIILVSLTSISGSWAHNNQLAAFNNVKIKALAEKYNYSFVDVYTPLLNLKQMKYIPNIQQTADILPTRDISL